MGTNAAAALWFGYDNAQQLKVASNTANSNTSTYENAFTYDLAGNRTSDSVFNPQTLFPNGTGHTYTPNSLNQLTNVSLIVNGATVESEPLLYDPNGNMTAGAANQTYEWDAANRLVAINYLSTGKRSEFTYDGGNRRVKIVEKGAGETAVAQPGDITYTDFSSAPFAAPAGSYTISFEGLNASPAGTALIDAVTLNNVLVSNGSFETPALTGTEYERYNPTGATWTFEGGAGIARAGSFFTDGNPAAPSGNQVAFLQGNDGVIRQTVTLAAGTYTLAFKAAQTANNKTSQQLRVTIEKTGLPTSVQRFVYNGNTIAEERDSTGATVTKRFFAEGEWRLNAKGDGKFYYTRDHLGSIREATNSSGVLQARYDYDVWGNSVLVLGTMNLDFGYTGHYFHAPSGFFFPKHRVYNPSLGRWLSRDPIAEEGGLNLYGYTGNNPLNRTDPLGLYVNVPLADKAAYRAAWQYLNTNPAAHQIFQQASASDTRFVVTTNSYNVNHFDKDSGTVAWDPNAAHAFDSGMQSPALALLHEFAHAVYWDENPVSYWFSTGIFGLNAIYDTDEERRVIEGIERAFAEDKCEAVRHNHKGGEYRWVPSPAPRQW